MPTSKSKKLIQEQADNLVRGLVDILPYPACIVSAAVGLVAMNTKAEELFSQGMDSELVVREGDTIDFGDSRYCVVRKNLNHSTDFVLCELHSGSNPIDRIRASTRRLDRALSEAL